MSDTKRGIIKAGSIVAIIMAVFTLIGGVSMLLLGNEVFNENAIVETYKQDEDFTYVEDGDSYYIEYVENGVVVRMTQNDILVAINIMKPMFYIVMGLEILISIATLVIANLLKKDANKGKRCTGKIVALLVMSIFTANTITIILMIIALCIKDKKITLENINEYYVEDKFE